MPGPHLRLLPGSLFGLTVAVEGVAVVLSWGLESRYYTIVYAVYAVVMVGAGALVARRHPGNAIGWLLCGFGLLNALASDAGQGWGLRAAAQGWPGGAAAEWISAASWLPSGFGWILIFVLFPGGRLPGPRWRWVPWVGLAGTCLALAGWVLSPDQGRELSSGHNPVAVDGLPTGALLTAGMTMFTGALLAAGLSLVQRFRRAQGAERLQLTWFAFAAAFAAVALPLSFVFWYVTPLAAVWAAVALTLLPVAACVAILRYRLYDIDVLIDRTLVYVSVTVLLAAAYGATALVLGTTLGRGSGWATAGATLVVAVAFRPLRERVQDLIDRHFHRARYHAVRRMTAFLEALRAGRAAPEDVEDLLRDLLGDPGLRLLVFLPESQVYVDIDGVPDSLGVAAPADVPARTPEDAGSTGDLREVTRVERDGRAMGAVRHERAVREDPTLLRHVLDAAGLAIEIVRLRVPRGPPGWQVR